MLHDYKKECRPYFTVLNAFTEFPFFFSAAPINMLVHSKGLLPNLRPYSAIHIITQKRQYTNHSKKDAHASKVLVAEGHGVTPFRLFDAFVQPYRAQRPPFGMHPVDIE